MFSVSPPSSLCLSPFSPFAPYYFILFPTVSSVLPRVESLRLALPELSRSRFKIIQLTRNHLYPRASSLSSPPQGRSWSLVLHHICYLSLATLYTHIDPDFSLLLSHSLSVLFSRALYHSELTKPRLRLQLETAARSRNVVALNAAGHHCHTLCFRQKEKRI